VGRAAGAIAGELDRGTLALLLAQPVARYRVVLAHLCVDLLTIPLLCLSLWAGTWLGAWLIGPIRPEDPHLEQALPRPAYILEAGPFKVRVEQPARQAPPSPSAESRAAMGQRLRLAPAEVGPALWLVGGLMFAMSGYTLWLSACGRSRWRVLGVAGLLTLLQFV